MVCSDRTISVWAIINSIFHLHGGTFFVALPLLSLHLSAILHPHSFVLLGILLLDISNFYICHQFVVSIYVFFIRVPLVSFATKTLMNQLVSICDFCCAFVCDSSHFLVEHAIRALDSLRRFFFVLFAAWWTSEKNVHIHS